LEKFHKNTKKKLRKKFQPMHRIGLEPQSFKKTHHKERQFGVDLLATN
jgi:hypothetical protein